jgi:prevent-host-death family protein
MIIGQSMRVVNISAAKATLAELIRQVMAGEEVVIARAGEPLVRLTTYQRNLTPRLAGQMIGRIWMAEDFDAPDPELETLFHASPIEPTDGEL